MSRELISKKTRYEFREYFTGLVLREIEAEFDAADVPCDTKFTPGTSGQRRSLVEQYYHAIDWTSWKDVRKVLVVYENVLAGLEEVARSHVPGSGENYAERNLMALRKWIEKDGFIYKNSKLIPVSKSAHLPEIEMAASEMDAPELHRQIERMRDAVEEDPRLAIGTAKEIIETTCKTILEKTGTKIDPRWDTLALMKETRTVLKLLPDDVPETAKGTEVVRRILSNLGMIAQGLSELRNMYGTGHGPKGKAKGLGSRHARLAAGAAATLAAFLLETFEERSGKE